MQKFNKKDIMSVINITFRLFIVCTIIAAVVASVNYVTKDKIQEYEFVKITEALDSVFKNENNGSVLKYDEVGAELTGSVTGLYEVFENDEKKGYGILCEPTGFKDVIRLLVAFDNNNSIIAVRVISLSETPGFGDRVKNEPEFTEQFVGKQNSIILGNDGVNALSGATVSSKAVTKGVNDAISMIKVYTSVSDNTSKEVEADGE